MNTIKQIKNKLLSCSVKPSLQRMEILKYLLEYKNHPTVDMIFSELSPSIPTLSKTTVYNTLKLLSDSGVIQSLNIDEKNVRYDGDLSMHAHFRCTKCGKILDIPLENQDKFSQISMPESGNFQVTECQVNYKGLCENCINN